MSYLRPAPLSGVSSAPTRWRVPRVAGRSLGSLGDDPVDPIITQPTLPDPTANAKWQADVSALLARGVKTMEMSETQKWLQIAATLSIPLAGAIWRMIFKKGSSSMGDGLS